LYFAAGVGNDPDTPETRSDRRHHDSREIRRNSMPPGPTNSIISDIWPIACLEQEMMRSGSALPEFARMMRR
jgi:hypothetical protein